MQTAHVRQDITAKASDFGDRILPGAINVEDAFVCHLCGSWTPYSAGGDNCRPEDNCRYCNPAPGEEQPPCGLICAECWCGRHPFSFRNPKPAFELPAMDRDSLSWSIAGLAVYYRDVPAIRDFAEKRLAQLDAGR